MTLAKLKQLRDKHFKLPCSDGDCEICIVLSKEDMKKPHNVRVNDHRNKTFYYFTIDK